MSNSVVTSQPTPSAPLGGEIASEKMLPSAPPVESVVLPQPINSEISGRMYAEVIQRRVQRNQDFCCFACADSCADDTWCWYIMCRMYCQCLGICCESCANCLDLCGEGCANCLQGCCESDQGGNDGCCSGSGGEVGGTNNDCCTGGDGDGCDCDCGGCFD